MPIRVRQGAYNCLACSILRMNDEGLLFGEISGITQYNRFEEALEALLAHKGLHKRLINGSDYPLPAVNFVIDNSKLEKAGFITEEEAEALREIYEYNPLLYDFVLKRIVKHPLTKEKFPPSVFYAPFY